MRTLNYIAALLMLAALGVSSPAQTAAKKKTTPTKAKATPARTKPSNTPATAKTPARYRRAKQMQPTQQRYREIQQALADKGFFTGPVDGNWGPDSIDALKRFQKDRDLVDDGKIGSLSLIALGLGSPHGTVPNAPAKSILP